MNAPPWLSPVLARLARPLARLVGPLTWAAARLPRPRRPRLAAALALLALACGVLTGWMLTYIQDLPAVRELESFTPKTSSMVYAADGTLLHEFAAERRVFLPYAEIPPMFIEAVVATEDSRFFEHWGVDFTGIARAMLKNLRAGGVVEGGSTITQQLAKLLFLTQERTFRRKVQDAILALQIEMRYSKERILELYVNQIYFGNGVYGLGAAADYYFGKAPKDLTLSETALLVGVIRGPHLYNPYAKPERARARRDLVLRRMTAAGHLAEEEASALASTPLILRERGPGANAGAAAGDYFVEEVRRILSRRFPMEQIYGGGLHVRTTLDPALQRAAEEALRSGLRRLDKEGGAYRGAEGNVLAGHPDLAAYEDPSWRRMAEVKEGVIARALIMDVSPKALALRIGEARGALAPADAAWARVRDFSKTFKKGDVILARVEEMRKDGSFRAALEQTPRLQGAFLALDVKTGAVRAMSGGYDFAASQFNRAVQARRQAGSAFKPIVYAAALEQGFTLATPLFDAPTAFVDRASGLPYFPENYERDFEGLTTARRALERSRNVVTVQLFNRLGARRVVETARRFGLEGPFSRYSALALGASEVTLAEMVSAFAAFANRGERPEPFFITGIESPALPAPETFFPRIARALSPEAAYVMAQALRGVVLRGTAARAAGLPGEPAGKTGTTNDHTDAWFIGFTPEIAVGVWVGHDAKRSLGKTMTGAHAALPVWMEIMEHVLGLNEPPPEEGAPPRTYPDYERPARVARIPVDRMTGLRATLESRCEDVILESFVEGAEPAASCSEAAHAFMALSWPEQRALAMKGQAPHEEGALFPAPPSDAEALRFLALMRGGARLEREAEDFEREILRVRMRLREGTPVAVEPVAR